MYFEVLNPNLRLNQISWRNISFYRILALIGNFQFLFRRNVRSQALVKERHIPAIWIERPWIWLKKRPTYIRHNAVHALVYPLRAALDVLTELVWGALARVWAVEHRPPAPVHRPFWPPGRVERRWRALAFWDLTSGILRSGNPGRATLD